MANCKITGLGVHIKVKDINLSRKFYESLGFTPVFGYGDDEFRASLPKGVANAPEKYRGVTYQISETSKLEIADGHIAVKGREVFEEMLTSPKISAMVNVESLIPLLKNPEISVTFPVRKYYWGTIEAAFRDPDGFVLVFIAPYSDEELAATRQCVEVEEVNPS